MAGVAFFFEEFDTDVYSGRLGFLDAWNYAFLAAGDITDVVIINRTDLVPILPVNYRIQIVSSEEEFLALASGDRITYIGAYNEFEETTSLWDFDHKTDWYFFGHAHGHKAPTGVTIPTARNTVFHSVHAATVVMTHRYEVMKWQ
jgi:hypothetical protein